MPDLLTTVAPLAFNSEGLRAFVIKNIVPLILLFIGVAIMARANKGNVSHVMTVSLIVVVGIVFIAGGALIYAFGDQLARLALGG